jgi:hypothetical protein
VKRVLLIGGYGTFGARIAERAAAGGFELLVAGRDLAAAEAFCAGRPGMRALRVDRTKGLAAVLAEHRPFAVVDAAGPFQGSDYSVAQAAIAAGCHYLDIADGRDFVTGIAALDAAAKRGGVCGISGASSLPALSEAAVRRLAEGMDAVRDVEIVLSASSRGTAGRAVTAAVLSYLGRPIRIWRGGRWVSGWGWQGLRRRDFACSGEPPLRRRLVALADVPDLELLPERLPGRPAVTFLAGTDLAFHNFGLWLLSWPVRWGLLRKPERLAGLLSALQHRMRGFGSLRSAMQVRVWGLIGERRIERRWTLIAGKGEGPEIPSLAVPILLGKLAAGAVPAGVGDAGPLLALQNFDEALNGLAAVRCAQEVEHAPPLYQRVMGERFDALPPAVKAMHRVFRDGSAVGRAEVLRGKGLLSRLVAATTGFPEAGEHDLHVSFAERDGVERWTRAFSGRGFSSRLSARRGRLEERFGPFSFAFELRSDAGGLEMRIASWRIGPLPLPLALAPRSDAREYEEEGRFHFDVPIALPLVGLVVHYRGWLEQPAR